MTINPVVSTENNTAWVSFASAMAVNPAAAATTAHIKPIMMIVDGAVMVDTFQMVMRRWANKNQEAITKARLPAGNC